jgi:UDP-N-acetyl-D-mannosaminuronic acid dehydrogenase
MRTANFGTVSVIGLGYIGLPTAAILAREGIRVIGVDINERVVACINGGKGHFVEPKLDELIHLVVNAGRLRATTDPEPADAFVIAVPTPFGEDRVPNLSYVEAAAKSIAPHLVSGNLVILESTSPVGTTEAVAGWLAAARPDLTFPQDAGEEADIGVAYCPERVLPGRVLEELVENERVLGGMTGSCSRRAAEFYGIFVKGACRQTTARTAEMCKLTENAFRDVNIAFANELSLICDRLDVNVWELIRLASCHPRVNILQPGPGVGGHCIAVDPWFIVHSAPEEAKLIRTAREVNDGKPDWVVGRVEAAAKDIVDPVVACLGLAFKPDIDDLRESPAVEVVRRLSSRGSVRLLVVEPFVDELPNSLAASENVELTSLEEGLSACDVVLLLVDHGLFCRIDTTELEGKIVIDTRGVWK